MTFAPELPPFIPITEPEVEILVTSVSWTVVPDVDDASRKLSLKFLSVDFTQESQILCQKQKCQMWALSGSDFG